MKRKTFPLQLAICSMLLCSCAKTHYEVQDYKLQMAYKDNFRICQITDLHLGVEEDIKKEFAHIEKMVKKMSNPDLIVITGDSFLDANKTIVDQYIKLVDSFDIPWTFTYGNHDLQGDYSYYYINNKIMNCKNKVFIDYKNDDIHGLTNFYINLTKDGNTKYRLYITDSNSYHNLGFKYGYDEIHKDQLEHLKKIVTTEGDSATGLMFMHIPVCEFVDAYEGYEQGLYEGYGKNNEPCCPPYQNNGAYDIFKEMNIKALFVGHDHINNSVINYKNEMIFAYGVKSSDLLYHDDEMIGYKEITLPSDPSTFGLANIKDVMVPYD